MDLAGLIGKFKDRFGGEPMLFAAPGRVNLIGEHTDYNEGFVLPFAIDKRTYAACAARDDRLVRIFTQTLDSTAELSLDEQPQILEKSWSRYVHGIAATLERRGHKLSGANMAIDSDIPLGAGLSSSAAFEVCAGAALLSVSGGEIDLREIALAGQEVEHEYMGLRSGLMDQLTSALARRGHLLLIDCRSNEVEHIQLDLGQRMLVICDTKVKHALASTEYNRRREECEEGVKILANHISDIRSLRDVGVSEFESHATFLPHTISRRCRHVVTENARVLATVGALERKDLEEVGRLMYLSHDSLRDDYEVSCPELDLLVDSACATAGVLGARMTGGGFGGCTINLIEGRAYAEFKTKISTAYRNEYGRAPTIFPVRPSDGARKVEL